MELAVWQRRNAHQPFSRGWFFIGAKCIYGRDWNVWGESNKGELDYD